MRIIFLLSLFLNIFFNGASANEAVTLLKKMSNSMRTHTYAGTLIYSRAGNLVTMNVNHAFKDGKESFKLRRLSGVPTERAKVGDIILHSFPGPAIMRSGYPIPHGIEFSHDYFTKSPYLFEILSQERVAERSVTCVVAEPLDSHRYKYKFWIDNETYLMLKAVTINNEGRIGEEFEFSEIHPGGLKGKNTKPSDRLQIRVHTITPGQKLADFSPSTWFPSGYSLVSNLSDKTITGILTTLVFSDGLGSFSLFLESGLEISPMFIDAIYGSTIALGRDFRSGEKVLRATLVGEIPIETGRSIIETLDIKGLMHFL